MNGMVGFNPDLVYSALKTLEVYYKGVNQLYGYDYQNKVIVPLSEAWYAPENKTVMEPMVAELKAALNDFARTAELLSNLINEGAQRWAESVGDVWNKHQIMGGGNILDASVMKDELNGFRGVITDKIPDILTNITNVGEETKELTENFAQNISGIDAFFGSDQMTNLITTLVAAGRSFVTASEDRANTVKDNINKTSEKYQSTAQTNATRFASGN